MSRVNSHQEVIDIFQEEGFQVGAHKALQIAQAANRVRILLVSDMPSGEVRGLLLTPMEDINQAISKVSADLLSAVRVAVMPRASSTIPILVEATSG
jgi:nickel-dependent lactate racemase